MNLNQQQQQKQRPSQPLPSQSKTKPVEKPKPKKPDEELKDPSIIATAEYLKEYATTVSIVLRSYISHMTASYIVEPRPISIGEMSFTQKDVYEFITKLEGIHNKSTQVSFAYIKKNVIECFLQVSFDKKGDPVRDAVRFVVHFRHGEIQRITLFGYREIGDAWRSFKVNGAYESESSYYRKITKTVNEILEKLKTEYYPQKQIQLTLGILGHIVKAQKLPCRACGSFVSDKDDELPTVLFGLGTANPTVYHPSCLPKESI